MRHRVNVLVSALSFALVSGALYVASIGASNTANSAPAESTTSAAACGGVGQVPCFLLGCDAGLVVSRGICVRRDNLGFPTNCGDWNEFACEVWAHIPSCKAGLVEHLGRCRKPDETFPSSCGSVGQRPCSVIEHIPSCKSALVESFGLCVARDNDGFPTNCGGLAELACIAIPACKPGLVLDLGAGATCLPCGEGGRPPCLDQLCKTGFRFDLLTLGCQSMGANDEPDLACTAVPYTTPEGQPLRGFADLHAHQFANLAFGGLQLWGKAFDPGGIRSALPWCDYATGINATHASGAPVIPTPFLGVPVHGLLGLDSIFEIAKGNGPHSPKGLGPFDGWPRWNTVTHQQMYYRWLERAFRGGLRLMVQHAVNNEVLCGSGRQIAGFGCDDMAAVDRQIAAAKQLEAFVDAEHGGPGRGWYRIAYSGREAREIIRSGKLAVVLGIEVDTLFGCRANGTCSPSHMVGQLQKYHDMGVRHVFPLHFFNNGYGAPAIYEDLLTVGNYIVTNAFYQTEPCPATYAFNLGEDRDPFADFLRTLFGVPPQASDPPPDCNAGTLTPLGDVLIRALMDKKMIIDVDHMSAKTLERVLEIAEAERYPLVSGHSEFLDIAAGQRRSERLLTSTFADRIRDLGGMFAPILAQATTDVTTAFGDTVANDCSRSSKSWAQAYLYAVEKMKGGSLPPAVGIGSDFNGGIESIGPRFGIDACDRRIFEMLAQTSGVGYPFVAHGRPGTEVFSRLRTGDRVFDINTDGVANVGMLPDFIQDLKVVGLRDEDLAPLFRSAEHYVAMWERIEGRGSLPPTTVASWSPSAQESGWHSTNVTVTLTATPASGGAGVSGVTYSGSGAHAIALTTVPGSFATFDVVQEGVTDVTFHARDAGGAVERDHSTSIRIDRTNPTAAASVSPAEPNENGWYNTDVTVTFTGADSLSGVDRCDPAVILATDGTNQTAQGRCTDRAGNVSAAAMAAGINIDKTPPVVQAPEPISLEVATPVTVTAASEPIANYLAGATATDTLDPVPILSNDAPLELPLGTTPVVFLAADHAGNAAEAASAVTLRGRPAIQWAPAAVMHGAPIGLAQLNASASFGAEPLAGAFSYSLQPGTVLNTGQHAVTVIFTPEDPARYVGATAQVMVTVLAAPPAPPATVALFLDGSGPVANPPGLFLDDDVPAGTTPRYRDSSGVKFGGGNAWVPVGTWSAAPAMIGGALLGLSDLHVWLGLKNSDDQGTRFDLRAEVFRNDILTASGQTYCVQGVTRNPDLAREATVSFSSLPPERDFDGTTDVLSLKIYARIGTDGAGVFCGGHSTAVGLRVYFDGTNRAAGFRATVRR